MPLCIAGFYGQVENLSKDAIKSRVFNIDIEPPSNGAMPSGEIIGVNIGALGTIPYQATTPVRSYKMKPISDNVVEFTPVNYYGIFVYTNAGQVSITAGSSAKTGALNGNSAIDFSKGIVNGVAGYLGSDAFASRLDNAGVAGVASAIITKNAIAGVATAGATLAGGVAMDILKSTFDKPASGADVNISLRPVLREIYSTPASPTSTAGGGGASDRPHLTYIESANIMYNEFNNDNSAFKGSVGAMVGNMVMPIIKAEAPNLSETDYAGILEDIKDTVEQAGKDIAKAMTTGDYSGIEKSLKDINENLISISDSLLNLDDLDLSFNSESLTYTDTQGNKVGIASLFNDVLKNVSIVNGQTVTKNITEIIKDKIFYSDTVVLGEDSY